MKPRPMPCPHCGEFVKPAVHCTVAGCGWVKCPGCLSRISVAHGTHSCPPGHTSRESCRQGRPA